ncbi:MAG: hypothetical protein II932_03645 [Treponema sp.]|nr:hypothetical protein [Treponema sp.]
MEKRAFASVLLCFVAFFLLSLSCASGPKQTTVKIANVRSWVVDGSVSVPCESNLSIAQWKYLVKELDKIDQLDNIKLSAGKGIASMNLESFIKISGVPLKYVYSVKPSAGELTLTILDIAEADPEAGAFAVTMTVDELEGYKASVVKKIEKDLTSHAEFLVENKVLLE